MKATHTHCFVAGQSGGHILPCITLAHEVLSKYPKDAILFFTTTAKLDIQLTQHLDSRFTVIRLGVPPIRGNNPLKLLYFYIMLITSFFTALYHLMQKRPQSVTSSGGICTIPVALAAYLMRIPIDLYELNVLPGKTTYFLSRVARTIYCCFNRTLFFLPRSCCKKSGYPVRFFHEKHHSRTESCNLIKLDPQKKTVLILGGSQGSVFINTAIKKWLSQTSITDSIQIIHQTGAHDTQDWHALYAQHKTKAIVFPFSHTMEQYYSAADLVICRSGAGTLFEVLYFHIPCITIPLELHSNAHQIHNAFTISQEYPELFTVLTQDTLNAHPYILEQTIAKVLHTPSTQIQPHLQTQAMSDTTLER